MSSEKEQILQLTDSETAKRMFINASIEYPSLVVAQGAMIARICKQDFLDPLQLQDALINDTQSLMFISNAGVKAHKGNDFAPNSLSTEKVKEIVTRSFNIASEYKVLPDFLLEQITNGYKNIKKSGQKITLHDERRFEQYAEKLIEDYLRD